MCTGVLETTTGGTSASPKPMSSPQLMHIFANVSSFHAAAKLAVSAEAAHCQHACGQGALGMGCGRSLCRGKVLNVGAGMICKLAGKIFCVLRGMSVHVLRPPLASDTPSVASDVTPLVHGACMRPHAPVPAICTSGRSRAAGMSPMLRSCDPTWQLWYVCTGSAGRCRCVSPSHNAYVWPFWRHSKTRGEPTSRGPPVHLGWLQAAYIYMARTLGCTD